MGLSVLLEEIQGCRVCEAALEAGVRPIVQAAEDARVLIIGQAPGRRVHASGVPWDDASGRRLRSWLQVTDEEFYDPSLFALVPMGFCYPGTGKSGDLPPRPECAPLWHPALLPKLPNVRLTLLLSRYALRRYLPESKASVTEAVRSWLSKPSSRVPLPHPSPRNQRWLARNPWFEKEVLPRLADRARTALSG